MRDQNSKATARPATEPVDKHHHDPDGDFDGDSGDEGTVIWFETSVGLLADETAKAGHKPMEYRVYVFKYDKPLPVAKHSLPGGEPVYVTWTYDAGFGCGYRDLEVTIYRRVRAHEIVSLSTFANDRHKYAVVLEGLDARGNTTSKETLDFNLGRHEIGGG